MTSASLLQTAEPVQSGPAAPACRVETLQAGRSREQQLWLRLFEQSTSARIHHHPDYVPAILPELPGSSWTIRCDRQDDPRAMAIFVPKRVKFGRQLLPGGSSALWGTRLAGFGLLGEASDDCVAKLVQTLADEVCRRRIRVVEFEEIDEDSLLWRHLQTLVNSGFRFVASTDFEPHHRIRLPQTVDEYWGRFRSKRRTMLRKKRKRLGNYSVRRFTNVEDVRDLLEAAGAVSVNTWQSGQFGLRIRGSEAERRYLEFLARQGALRSYVLFVESQPVAFGLGHQWNRVYHYDEVGFDRRFVELSPGNVLLQEIIDDLLTSARPDIFDFGLGDADYKRFFSDEQLRSATLRMFAPGLAGWWQTTSLTMQQTLTRSARRFVKQVGVAAHLRRRLRDHAATTRPY